MDILLLVSKFNYTLRQKLENEPPQLNKVNVCLPVEKIESEKNTWTVLGLNQEDRFTFPVKHL